MASPTVSKTPSVSKPQPLRQDADTESSTGAASTIDIEHVPVNDDPRQWSPARKTTTLCIVSLATMMSALASNIQNPSNSLIEVDLHATSSQISWTLAAFLIIQGNFPLLWSAASEIKGRKPVYLVASALFVVGSAALALSKTIEVMIGMRALQAAGSCAAMSISAATLADVYDTHERGTTMGIFFAAPLLGPALGPILGGSLSQAFDWRASFYFMLICAAVVFLSFLVLFKDTYRRERSLTYCSALQRLLTSKERVRSPNESIIVGHESNNDQTPVMDVEKQLQPLDVPDHISTVTSTPGLDDVKLSLRDINPFPPCFRILSRKNNVLILIANGLIFGFTYCLSYTCSRTLANAYDYSAFSIGLVLLCLGVGSIAGSVLSGRWSDRVLAKMIEANGGKWHAEMRLESSKLAMLWLPPFVVGYAWVCEKHVHVAVICVMLLLIGFSSIWMYTSTLAYLVDANPGRSCSAVATNSSVRGSLAFVSVLIAVPLQDVLGDGGLYSAWAGVMVVMELLVILVLQKGESWRKESEERELNTK
ncbi:major facilitator superfamily domain-containing protein [Suillus subaureus]|uniref:Major facilitator superfamily domain-containing protein n=1 Tax=Suillus subaureus TaxID=48587 RepID=A0A9P7JI25_9AGAM|nr:major facilitator superfamily domain-containing protein [Suillus subaureus]KAG1823574.1 major facilitator superfamily domain-containing protein [Suillus subaureus]